MPDEKVLLNWILSNIRSKDYERFSDLHVDELTKDCSTPSRWLEAIRSVADTLINIRDQIPSEFCVSIGTSLRSEEFPLEITFRDDVTLAEEFEDIPPSIYVFKKGTEPWEERPTNALIVPPGLLSCCPNDSKCVYFEYKEDCERQYRRSIWIVIHH